MPPPPPVTPSRHRFIIKRESAHIKRAPLAQSHTPQPSTQHFNSTPRFTFPSIPRPTGTQTLPEHSPTAPRFTTPSFKKEQDVIEDLSSDDTPDHVHESIEHDDEYIKDEGGKAVHDAYVRADENDQLPRTEEPTPKRRRLTSPMLLDEEDSNDSKHHKSPRGGASPSSIPSLSSPRSKRQTSPHSTMHHKFLLTTSALVAEPFPQTSPDQKSFVRPPRFLPPELTEETSEPLPEQFSPHRKGHKYIPGGMASELRDWLTNISSSIPPQKSKKDPWLLRILIDEVSSGEKVGMTMVKGRQVHDEGNVVDSLGEVRCVLAGEGMGVGLQKGKRIKVGSLIGINGPVWEIVVMRVKWGVVVEWKVL